MSKWAQKTVIKKAFQDKESVQIIAFYRAMKNQNENNDPTETYRSMFIDGDNVTLGMTQEEFMKQYPTLEDFISHVTNQTYH